jgi:hypothetical protein
MVMTRSVGKNYVCERVFPATMVCLLAITVMVLAGCAQYTVKSPSQDVKTFFVAANETNYLGTINLSPGAVDLSAYSHLAGVKYPPTYTVEVLSQPPTRPYKSFAVLEYDSPANPNTGAVIEGFREKAKEIGADAIVICQPGSNQGLAGLAPSAKMQAVAIKYKLADR